MDILLIFGVSGVVFGGASAILASNKKRDVIGWFVLGFLFNLVALIVIAALPPSEAVTDRSRDDSNGDRDTSETDQELRDRAADLKAALAESRAKLGR